MEEILDPSSEISISLPSLPLLTPARHRWNQKSRILEFYSRKGPEILHITAGILRPREGEICLKSHNKSKAEPGLEPRLLLLLLLLSGPLVCLILG